MPTLMRSGGSLVRVAGKLGISAACCCDAPYSPPVPQTCCYDRYPTWADWPNPIYGRTSGFGCAVLNRAFQMYLIPPGTLNIPSYISDYLGGVDAIPCVAAQHDWTWRLRLDCSGDLWTLGIEGTPWSTTPPVNYPVTLLNCDPLQLVINGLTDALFGLTTSNTGASIVFSSLAL